MACTCDRKRTKIDDALARIGRLEALRGRIAQGKVYHSDGYLKGGCGISTEDVDLFIGDQVEKLRGLIGIVGSRVEMLPLPDGRRITIRADSYEIKGENCSRNVARPAVAKTDEAAVDTAAVDARAASASRDSPTMDRLMAPGISPAYRELMIRAASVVETDPGRFGYATLGDLIAAYSRHIRARQDLLAKVRELPTRRATIVLPDGVVVEVQADDIRIAR